MRTASPSNRSSPPSSSPRRTVPARIAELLRRRSARSTRPTDARDGGGWRAHGRGAEAIQRNRHTKVGFDHVHSLVDDHSRLAYSEILPDEKGSTCAAFLDRAIAYFAAHGIARIERLITDNAWSYRYSLHQICAQHGIKQKFIKPHCPCKTARSNASTAPCKPNGPTVEPS
jgi:Integrase core domain